MCTFTYTYPHNCILVHVMIFIHVCITDIQCISTYLHIFNVLYTSAYLSMDMPINIFV